jgi:hypothetical protein
MNADQPWITAKDAAANDSKKLFSFSSTCWYFGESLAEKLGPSAPPIGLIHTAYGGSQIEAWVRPEDNSCIGTGHISGSLWRDNVSPYLNTTVRGCIHTVGIHTVLMHYIHYR